MSGPQSRILDRVRKLERLAADPEASPGERDNAARMAAATRRKYNIDPPRRSPVFETPKELTVNKEHRKKVDFLKGVELSEWEAKFINSIADRLDCDSFLTLAQAVKLDNIFFEHRKESLDG